jgi:PAS domain-containing protein
MHFMTSFSTSTTPASELRYDPYLLDDRPRYQMMQASHSGSTVLIDEDGVIRYTSPSAQQVLAIGKQGAEGEALLSVIHRQDILNAMVNLDRIRRRTDTTVSWVSRLRTRDRWEWFKVSATGFRYDRGHHPVAALFLQPLNSL